MTLKSVRIESAGALDPNRRLLISESISEKDDDEVEVSERESGFESESNSNGLLFAHFVFHSPPFLSSHPSSLASSLFHSRAVLHVLYIFYISIYIMTASNDAPQQPQGPGRRATSPLPDRILRFPKRLPLLSNLLLLPLPLPQL